MRKLFKRLHLWLSLPFGLIIMTTCLTGALLTFEQELTQLAFPSRYRVTQVQAEKLPIQTLIDRAAATLPDSVSITGVTIPSAPERTYALGLSKPRKAGLLIDPYTGEVKGRSDRTPFYSVVFRLHRWLLDNMKPAGEGIFWGRIIVGTSTLLFIFVLISGLVIWWPRKLKDLRKQLRISLHHGRHRLFYGLHAVGGVYVSLLLLIAALTGLTWSFEWYRTGFYGLFGVSVEKKGKDAPAKGGGKPEARADKDKPADKRPEGQAPRGEGRERESKDKPKAPKTYLLWDQVYCEVATRSNAYHEINISEDEARGMLGSLNSAGNNQAADTYHFDAETGAITKVKLYKDAKLEKTLKGWIYTVHTGAWGGLVTRILACLAALFGASLPLTGYYLFFKRKLAQRRNKAKKA